MTEDERIRNVLFNDLTRSVLGTRGAWLPLSLRRALADELWAQGWRRDVRPEDIGTRTSESGGAA